MEVVLNRKMIKIYRGTYNKKWFPCAGFELKVFEKELMTIQ